MCLCMTCNCHCRCVDSAAGSCWVAEPSPTGEQEHLENAIERVTAYRKEILDMVEDSVASILLKQQKLGLADQTLETVRHAPAMSRYGGIVLSQCSAACV